MDDFPADFGRLSPSEYGRLGPSSSNDNIFLICGKRHFSLTLPLLAKQNVWLPEAVI